MKFKEFIKNLDDDARICVYHSKDIGRDIFYFESPVKFWKDEDWNKIELNRDVVWFFRLSEKSFDVTLKDY